MAASKKKSAPKKSASVKTSASKRAAKKPAPAKKSPAKKAPGKKAPAKKAPAKKAPAKKLTAKSSPKTSSKAPAAKSKASPKAAPKKGAPKQTKVAAVVAQVKKTVKDTFAKVAAVVSPDYAGLLKPLDDRILVAAEAASEKTASGLIIPGSATERPTRGKVLAVGNGRRNKKGQVRPLDVVVGDHVIFADGAGLKVTLGSSEFLVLREEELLGVAE